MASLEEKRHTLAHLLAAAVSERYPHAKATIGPAVENGFYYDFDFSGGDAPGDADLSLLATAMKELLPSWTDMSGTEVSEKDARDRFKDNPYKLEIVEGIVGAGEPVTLYTAGDFTDLCRGGHSVHPAHDIKADTFALDRIAGAYWRGDEKNPMLTRIYGLAFDTKEDLAAYRANREEMEKRDHRRIGKEQGLWTFSEFVGAGLPLFTPKGTVIRNALFEALRDISEQYDMLPVTIPHIAKRRLYELSGHADKFGDELLTVTSHYDEFVLKPVNCPHHTQIYAAEPKSYRDLPLRLMESTMQYRDERPGEIGGLTRVRAITVDDGHIFCRIDQVEEEASNIANIIKEFYSMFGMWGNHWVSLSVRDPQKLDDYIGDEEGWTTAESMLANVSSALALDAKRMEGEAALYGPKLDFMFTDALGRERQLATIQIDFAMPKRFGLEYTAEDGTKQTPVMIHRAILGSYERFMALLIEHYAGAFPVWLSPFQVRVLPVSEKQAAYAHDVKRRLKETRVRADVDDANESLGKRIRNAKVEKVPYVLVVGDAEADAGTVSVESRDAGKLDALSVEDFAARVTEEVRART